MGGPRPRWMLCCIALLSLACNESRTSVCADESVCPPGRVCDEAHGTCVDPSQVEACAGRGDGDTCELFGNEGVCDQGVCQNGECGDGYRTGGEACDDGNTEGGDDCSADCSSSEVCGNGILDSNVGEQCDCADSRELSACAEINSDLAGAECRTDCLLHCGDGIVNVAEQCDTEPAPGGCLAAGFDRGPLDCTDSCVGVPTRCARFGIVPDSGADPGALGIVGVSMYIDAAGDVFIAGKSAVLASRVAGVWTVTPPGSLFLSFSGVDGAADGTVIAVGHEGALNGASTGRVRSWDGAQWANFPPPPTVGLASFLEDVSVESDTEIYAVGREVDGFGEFVAVGRIWEYNGSDWSVEVTHGTGFRGLATGGSLTVAVGTEGAVAWKDATGAWATHTLTGAPTLSDVFVADESNAFAVGLDGAIFHFDGTIWTPQASHTTQPLSSVAGVSASQLWARGPSELLYYDGRTWDRAIDRIDDAGALAAASSRVFATGDGLKLVELIDADWVERSSALFFFTIDHRIFGAGDDVFVTRDGNVSRWTGSGIAPVTSFLPAASDLAAVGGGEILAARSDELIRWNGSSQQIVHQFSTDVRLISADLSTTVVGADDRVFESVSGAEFSEHVLVFDGAGDSLADVATVGGVSFAATRQGELWTNASGGWARLGSVGEQLSCLYAASAELVFACGGPGTIWQIDSGTISRVVLDTDQTVTQVHGADAADVFAATTSTLHRFDGSAWSPVRSPGGALGVYSTDADVFLYRREPADLLLARLHRPTPW